MDKKDTSPSTEIQHLSINYHKSKYWSDIRYIHKYYLPQELKPCMFLADIHALWNEWHVFDGNIPSPIPSCSIHYDDLGLEKIITGHDVRLVLQAIAAYSQDRNAELTDDENRAAINLNSWLTEWEKLLLAECIRVSEEMELRVRSGDLWLTDYEIDIDVQFYLRDDDPFSEENNPDANDHDVDSDASLLCSTERLSLSGQDIKDPHYWGIGDGQDHNDGLWCGRKNSIYAAKHCAAFHELYDHLDVPMKHMGRIGRVYADIIVMHQNGISIDTTGAQPLVVQDAPRIRDMKP